ncbi:hypothetical protein V6Z11_1Z025700 [Gossypium hirsutum]
MGLYKSRICKRSQNLWDEHVELDATFGSFHSQARLGSVVDIIQLKLFRFHHWCSCDGKFHKTWMKVKPDTGTILYWN